MKDSIIINVPYQTKIFGIELVLRRKIGFLFTNRAKAVLYDIVKEDGCKTAQEYEKKYGMSNLINQMLYCSAVAYCMDPKFKVKQNFTREKLIIGISIMPESEQKILIKVMGDAQDFGVPVEKKKPKLTKSH